MARFRRRREDPEENLDRWLVSYADFVTLLFAFFVVMYAVSSVNEGKYRVLSNSIVQAFRATTGPGQAPTMNLVPTPLPAMRPPEARRQAQREEQKRQTREKMKSTARQLSEVLAPLVKDGRVRVTETALGVTLEINASVLFATGEAVLAVEAQRALTEVGRVLAGSGYPVTVEGHTDNVPIRTAQFPSNWELSSARASAVVRLFIESGVPAARLVATGLADQRPVAGNDSAEGRARNRRVNITIESERTETPVEIPLSPPP